MPVGDPCVGVVPGIMYLYIELLAAKTTMVGGTTNAITNKTAATVKTRFLCIKTPLTIILFQGNKHLIAGIQVKQVCSDEQGIVTNFIRYAVL